MNESRGTGSGAGDGSAARAPARGSLLPTRSSLDRRWARMALAGIALLTLARVVYTLWLCPYALIEDEAHYWEWARRLDLSYYTKGPGVAWTIAASQWALGLVGEPGGALGIAREAAVRLPAPLAHGVLLLAVLALALRVTRGDGRASALAACATALTPAMQALGVFSTIDGPYLACWALACLAAWGALARGSRWAWIGLGLAVGAGFLYKYTILLLPPGLALFALLAPKRTVRLHPRAGLWALGGAAALAAMISPVIIWNAREGWPTVAHLLGHLGVPGGDTPEARAGGWSWRYDPAWTLEFIGTQFGLVGPVLALAIGGIVWTFRTRRLDADDYRGRLFLVCCGLPVLGFYLLVTLITDGEGNWPLAAYTTLVPLGGLLAAEGLREWRVRYDAWVALPAAERPRAGLLARRPETPRRFLWRLTVVWGVLGAVLMLRLDLASHLPWIGEKVPLGRVMSGREMGEHAAELVQDLRARTGQEPFIVAEHYGRASLLAFYGGGSGPGGESREAGVPVLCVSRRLGGRATQYDYWPDTDLDDPGLVGRPAVLVGGDAQGDWRWVRSFERVEPIGRLRGDTKRGREAWLGFGYRGWVSPLEAPASAEEAQ